MSTWLLTKIYSFDENCCGCAFHLMEICGTSVYILFISSKWLGIVQTNLETLIKDSVRSFSHIYTQNLKYLRMRN